MPSMSLPKQTSHLPWLLCLLAPSFLIPGCSDKVKMGEVSGTIQIDGKPAKNGAIAFFPVDRKSPTTGATIEEGRYTARVPLGRAKVEIRVSRVIGHKKLYDAPNSPVQPILEEVLPDKYNNQTELLLDVEPGKNQKDFDLKTS